MRKPCRDSKMSGTATLVGEDLGFGWVLGRVLGCDLSEIPDRSGL